MTPVIETEQRSSNSLSAYGMARSTISGSPLSPSEQKKIDAYWRACKYLALGMIYLQDNPLLKEPLKPEHIKNRLLGPLGIEPRPGVHLHPSEPPDQEVRPGHDFHGGSWAWRAWRSGSGLSRGDLLRDLSRKERRRAWPARVLQTVFVSRRHRQSLHAGDSRLDPRRRRIGIRAFARLRRGFRQSLT